MIDKTDIIAVDIETTGLKPFDDKIKIISWANNEGVYVSENIDDISYILANKNITKYFHNVIFDVPFLQAKGYEVNNVADTKLLSQVLGKFKDKHTLSEVAKRYLKIDMDKQMQHSKYWQEEITEQHIEYAKKDAEITYKLAITMLTLLEKSTSAIKQEYKRNTSVLNCIIRAKFNGIKFDLHRWELDQYQLEEKLAKISNQMYNEIQNLLNDWVVIPEFININSNIDMLSILKIAKESIKSTEDSVLAQQEVNIPLAKLLRSYRKYKKLLSGNNSFINSIEKDGRIHANWNVYGAETGRMSCSIPNIQQVPKEMKKYFIAEKGNVLISCDYSQIELRVAAVLSKDKVMLSSFEKGEDLHMKTAKAIFNKDVISKEERQIAKTCNFGLIYGMTPVGLVQRLKQKAGIEITKREAKAFINKFFRLYRGIKQWHIKLSTKQKIQSLSGKQWRTKNLSYMQVYNYPIQATAAEGLKEALILLYMSMKDEWKLCAIIHDEIVIEVPKKDSEKATEYVKKCMIEGMGKVLGNISIKVDVKKAISWEK